MHVAAVATAFPSGRAALDVKLADTQDAVEAGADEIDMVIDRGAFLSGRYLQVFDEIVARPPAQACGERAPQGDLRDRRAADLRQRPPRVSWLAMLAGADFIKTSTGKVQPAATLPVTLVMLEAVRDFREQTGQHDRREAGRRHPHQQGRDQVPRDGQRDRRRRTGSTRTGSGSAPPRCSTTCCMQRTKLTTGRYSGPDYFTLD